MPSPTRSGGMSAMATGFGSSLPKLSSWNGVTIARTGNQYAISGGTSSRYAYLTVPIDSGKWYWESSKGADELIDFLTGTIQAYSSGGFSGTNAGITSNGFAYSQWGTAGSGSAITTERVGMAYDASTKTFSWYKNNTLISSWVLTGGPSAIYPCFGFGPTAVGSGTQTVYFSTACAYSPPSGYSYL